MIKVGKVKKDIKNGILKLSCQFSLNNQAKTLWYETSSNFESYISEENCDPFFIILLLLAFKKQSSISFESPVSKKLYYGLNNTYQDFLSYKDKNYKRVGIQCKFNTERHLGNGVATAMSLGVDSFDTVLDRINDDNDRVNYLTIFNAGAFGQDGGELSRKYFHIMKEKIQIVADKLKLPLLWVDTNLNEILNSPFVFQHTYRNISCALLFDKILSTYYYSSGISLKDTNILSNDPAYYDLLNSAILSTESTEIRISGGFKNRVDKTKIISEFDIAKEHLNVCLVTADYKNVNEKNERIKNCSKCYKCVRTMVTLDVLGKINEFNKVFNNELYKKNRAKYIGEILYHYYRSKNNFSQEIIYEIRSNKFKTPTLSYYYVFLRSFKAAVNKLKATFN